MGGILCLLQSSNQQLPEQSKKDEKFPEPKPSEKKDQIKLQFEPKKESPKQENKQIPAVKEQSGIKPSIQSIGQYVLWFGNSIYNVKSQVKETEAFTAYLKQKQQINNEYAIPLKKLYQNLPQKISNAKLDVIQNYSFNERFAAVNLIALGTALFTLRKHHNYELINHSLVAFRNAGIAYLTSGLFIAPEMYNPLMKDS